MDPKKIACTTSKCPCYRNSEGCSRRCRYYNCKNEKMQIKRRRNHLLRSANKMVGTLIEKDHLGDWSPDVSTTCVEAIFRVVVLVS